MINDDFLKEIQEGFLVEADDLLEQAEALFMSLERDEDHFNSFEQLKRLAHNFKGSGKAVGFDELSKFCHSLENLLVALSSGAMVLTPKVTQLLLQCNDALRLDVRKLREDRNSVINHGDLETRLNDAVADKDFEVEAPLHHDFHEMKSGQFNAPIKTRSERRNNEPAVEAGVPRNVSEDFIRISLKKIDELLDSFGEQVIFLSALDFYKDDLDRHHDDVIRTVFNLKKLAFDLQQSTLNLRMVTLKSLFSKLERAIRDAAIMTNKKVDCILSGTEQELDKVIVDQLSDPLIHMVRNSVDHGIEDNGTRRELKKREVGTIYLRAKREGGLFVIEVQDDGKGLDPEKILQKAISKGLVSPNEKLTREQIFDLIFENGFSTKDSATELSGRGVGMNVVKQMILSLKGSYEITSEVGQGSLFRIKLPLTLSLFNGLLVRIDTQKFVIPSSQILEIVTGAELQQMDLKRDTRICQLRDEVIEMLELPKHLVKGKSGVENTGKRKEMLIVSPMDRGKVGFLVNSIYGIQRIVQKPLSPEMTTCPGASGVTILGDGSPAIILDLRALKERIKGNDGVQRRAA
jgi:two-component system chemotaxis sensor kinase CheA